MFCTNCGKNLPDNAKFCDACGFKLTNETTETPVEPQATESAQEPVGPAPDFTAQAAQQPNYNQNAQQMPNYNNVPQQPYTPQQNYNPNMAGQQPQGYANIPQQPQQPAGEAFQKSVNEAMNSPIVKNYIARIKGVFSKNTVKAVGEAAKSNEIEWVLLLVTNVIIFALSMAITVKHGWSVLLKPINDVMSMFMSGFSFDKILGFFPLLLSGLFLGAITYFLMSGAIFVSMKFIMKKNVNIMGVFNLVATAALPLSAAYILSTLFSFIWMPSAIIFTVTAFAITTVLLYAGIQKLDKLDKSPIYVYAGVWFVVVVVLMIVVSIIMKLVFNSMASNITDSLGGMSSLF